MLLWFNQQPECPFSTSSLTPLGPFQSGWKSPIGSIEIHVDSLFTGGECVLVNGELLPITLQMLN